MKTLKYIMIALLLVAFSMAAISFAETARLGADRMNFNPTRTVVKTAAYTVTTADSYVKVTASSANIVITLPTVDACLAGMRCSFKIEKTDATSYAIIVTPATGDTIGGESTRYLVGDDSYMIISAGPGKDWSIEYESPYIVENHEAGTYTTGIGSGGLYSAQTASVTLTASDCGNIISMGTGTTIATLPATVANCKFTIINDVGAPGPITITPNAADNIYGGCTLASSVVTISDTAGDAVINTAASSVKGDYMILIGDGDTGWRIIGCQGIWAEL